MLKRVIKYGFYLGILGFLFVMGLNFYIDKTTSKFIFNDVSKISKSYTGLVLGAKVYSDGNLSVILKDRVEAALELYNAKKINRFLLSGDHGRVNYDEVNSMKAFLIEKGVPTSDIFLDHAGFDTYNSIYRAKKIFKAEDIIIITQGFHVKRAVYIAQKLGLKVTGFTADKHKYGIAKRMYLREKVANFKAFLEIVVHRKPKYLGKTIPITGDSSKSYD